MKASNNVNGGGGSSSNNFSILHQNPNFTSPLKAILPDVSSVSSYQLDVDQIIIKREESQNIRRPNKSSPPSSPPVADDSELSIFDARNYFNDSIVNNNSSTTQQQQKKKILNIHQHHHIPAVYTPASQLSASLVADGFRRRSGSLQSYATPTASSEASWNSHTGLLTNRPDGALSISESSLRSSSRLELDPAARKNKGGPGPAAARWFLFRRKICPCSGKKSVQVKKIKPTSFLATTPISYSSRPKNEVIIPAAAPHTTIIRMQEEEESVVVDDSDKTVANSNYNCTRISVGGGGGGGGGFTFPNLLNPPTNSYTSPMIKNVLINTRAAAIHHLPHDMMMSERVPFAAQEDLPRDSLEVFQPSGGGDGRRGLLIRNSVVKASAASRPRPRDDDDGRLVLSAFVPPAAFSSPPRPVDTDDMGSDASSDLFEIESLSTTDQSSSYPIMTASTYRPHPAAAAAALLTGRHRDSLDEARPRFSTANNSNNNNNYYDDQYEPSEASVAWTVTTAAYDQASMAGCSVSASDVEEFTRLQVRLHHHLLSADQNNTTTINDQGGRRQIRSDPSSGTSGGGILMSCRCEKAVSVGPDPVKFHAPLRSSGGGSTFRHVSGRVEGGRDNKPPLTTSHGARLSLAFAT